MHKIGRNLLFGIMFLLSGIILAQQKDSSKVNLSSCVAIQASLGGTALVGLYQLWYKDYPSSAFHFFDDSRQWRGMDKLGHFYSGYYLSQLAAQQFKFCNSDKAVFLGGLSALIFLTTIEIFDGFSEEWGFSVADFGANILGAGSYMLQDRYLGKQIIVPKFSFHRTVHAYYRPNLLGATFPEMLFKNYNGQTYWLASSLGKMGINQRIPWLGLAVGYSASGMLGGLDNPSIDNMQQALPIFTRRSQLYLSLAIDFDEVKTNKKWVKTCLRILNGIKMPLPTVYWDEKLRFHPAYF